MGLFTVSNSGSFKHTESFLSTMQSDYIRPILERYAQDGVAALASATPIDSGLTSSSWDYTITINDSIATIQWINNNDHQGFNVAINLQYGHGTGTGGYVTGIDYINPSIKPVMDSLVQNVWDYIQKA